MNRLTTALQAIQLDEKEVSWTVLIDGCVPASAHCLLNLAEGGLS